jgi:hypothetical protein
VIDLLKTCARGAEGRRMARRLASFAALCALLAAPLGATAEIYRWTDEDGVERFSDRIENVPERFRSDVTAELGEERPAPAKAEPVAPVVPEEPPAAPVPDPLEAPPAQRPDWTAQMLSMGAAGLVGAALVGVAAWLLVTALALRLACRVVAPEVPGWGRAFGVALVQMLGAVALGAALGGMAMTGVFHPASLAAQGLQLVLGFGVNALVIMAMLALGFGRALLVALVEGLVSIAIGLVVGVGITFLAARLAGAT